MSDKELAAARAWAKRARELLDKGRRDAADQDAVDLQRGLKAFAADEAVRAALAPELTTALDDLAGALVIAPSAEGGTPAEPPSPEARKLYDDFRAAFDRQRRALVNVLRPAEAGSFELALDLAADQAGLSRFEQAVALLQQAAHRLRAIAGEKRSGERVDTEAEEAARSEAERRDREAALKAAVKQATERIAALMAQLQPMSRSETVMCTRFGLALQEQMVLLARGGDPLAVLTLWQAALEATAKDDQGNQRRDRKREALAAEAVSKAKLAGANGLAANIARLRSALAASDQPLADAAREMTLWSLGAPQTLESEMGALQYELRRQLQSLEAQDVSTEAGLSAAARQLGKADAAADALRKKVDEAPKLIAAAKAAFQKSVAERQGALDAFLKPLDEAIAKKEKDVAAKQKAVEDNANLRDWQDKKITNPFSDSTLKFYEGQVTSVGAKLAAEKKKKTPNAGEVATLTKQLAAAQKAVAANAAKAGLDKSLSDASAELATLEETRTDGRAPLERALEAAKRPLDIAWADPAEMDYGTPLDASRLNATLSVASGTLRYETEDGQVVVPGKTTVPAGAARKLRATVVGHDEAVFRTPPPREVTIKVNPGAVTLTCQAAVEIDYGTPFAAALLAPAVATAPSSEPDHAGLLKTLVCLVDGQPVEPGRVLEAKVHALTARIPASANHQASPDVAVSLTVKPARRGVAWAGAAPLTMTYPAPLTDKQLNATVSVTADPPLSEALAKPGRRVEYVDENGKPVKAGDVLPAGEARRVTARTPVVANFDVAEAFVVFRVEKAARALAEAAAAGAIGAVVQSQDLKLLRTVFKFTAGGGEQQFFVGGVELAVGAKLAAGKDKPLRVAARPDDNYQPAAERQSRVDVLGYKDKHDGVDKQRTDTLAKTVHSTQATAIAALKAQVDALAGATDEAKFAKLDELAGEVAAIDARMARWKGDVPEPVPAGDAKLLKVDIQTDDNPTEGVKKQRTVQKTVEAVIAMVSQGGLTVEDVQKLVPKGTADTYKTSDKYPDGFKYQWTTPSGVTIEIYGHGATVSNHVPATADSKQGNLVRIKVDGDYVQPDGSFAPDKFESTSHMALY